MTGPQDPGQPDRAQGGLRLRHHTFPPQQPLIMGIVNRTPDSFYRPGLTWDESAAMDRTGAIIAEGADIIDIGGIPAAPGQPVDTAEEIRRTAGFIAAVRAGYPDVVISVDTWRHETARAACAAGADLINDSWGGHDDRLGEVAAEFGAGLVCSHAGRQQPRTRPFRVWYPDVMGDVLAHTLGLAERAVRAGVDPARIVIDPAHDFGKNTWHSLELTRRLGEMTATGWPVLVSLSNKDFVGETLNRPAEDRLAGTLAATAISAWHGARIFRVHQVAESRQVVDMVASIRGDRPGPRRARDGLTMLVAAAVCPAPPLLARELTGADPVIPDLRQACAAAVAAALDSQPDLVVVVGVAETAERFDPAGRLDLGLFAPALRSQEPGSTVPGSTAPQPRLPPAVGLGAMLLDLAGYAGPRELHSVSEDESAATCADLGRRLGGGARRVAMLVLADGTARRTLKAPGYLDERSVPFDDEVIRALSGPDLSPLLAVDAQLARDLMATGRPAWQVLAGAAGGLRAAAEVRYAGDPFGVFYLVASLAFALRPAIALRPVQDDDLDAIFDQMRDPESVRMAAFTAADPGDRAAFDAHMQRVRTAPGITLRAVTCDGELAGHVASFVTEGDTEVTYWIGRAWWGRGVASRALELLLEVVTVRPLHARAASDNAASLRVLARAGFVPVGREISYAPARRAQIEETILRKD